MNSEDAKALLAEAVRGRSGTWADFGAGTGTFSRALAGLLGPTSRVLAIDRDEEALLELRRLAAFEAPNVEPVRGDFTEVASLRLEVGSLDGMLFANALHFVPRPELVLTLLLPFLRPRGRVVLVEYDRRAPTRWVPYPIPVSQVELVMGAAGLAAPRMTATAPSEFGGTLYVATTSRIEHASADAGSMAAG